MGYDKSEAKKTNRYTFRWNTRYTTNNVIKAVFSLLGLYLIWSLIRLLIKDFVVSAANHVIVGDVLEILILLVPVSFLLIPFIRIIRCIEIESNKITIVRLIGKTTLKNIVNIEYVTKELLEESGTEYYEKSGWHDGLTMWVETDHRSKRYGKFSLYCVNFDELAMVTCADGKKYLINYPKELFQQTADIHVCKPKLKLKWKVGRVLAVISITSAFIALIALLLEGMFIEFLILLLVTVFLLLPFGLSMIIETVKHIRIGRDRITILLSSYPETIVLDNIESIQYVTRKELEPSTTYATQFLWFQRPRTCRGLSMWGKVFSNNKYGKFTRACNNFDELAMVTLANGKKYLINYPKELLEKK